MLGAPLSLRDGGRVPARGLGSREERIDVRPPAPLSPTTGVCQRLRSGRSARGVCVRSGETYYRNTHTAETTWDKPTAPAPKEVSALPEGWEAVTSSK